MEKKIFSPNFLQLNWSGFWPGGPPKTKIQFFRCGLFMIISFALVIVPEIYFIYKNFSDMIRVLQCVSETLSIVLSFFKMCLVLYYRNKLRPLINDMQLIWENNKADESDEWKKICKFTEKQSKILSFAYVLTYVGFGTNFMLNPIIVSLVRSHMSENGTSPSDIPMPIELEFPFDVERSFGVFITTAMISTAAIFTTILILSSFDAFYLSMINYASAYFTFVNFKLDKFKNQGNDKEIWDSKGTDELMVELKVVVKHHGKAIEIVDLLEEVSHIFMLVQYLSSTFLLCVVGFQLSVLLKNTYYFIRILTYCLCLNMQLFTFSWFGSKLMEESERVGSIAYGCHWYNKPVKFQKSMILMMVRSQREVGISAAKFYKISLHSFSRVLSTSISYFTLLQTVYERK